jgi:aminopeptidase YwaD
MTATSIAPVQSPRQTSSRLRLAHVLLAHSPLAHSPLAVACAALAALCVLSALLPESATAQRRSNRRGTGAARTLRSAPSQEHSPQNLPQNPSLNQIPRALQHSISADSTRSSTASSTTSNTTSNTSVVASSASSLSTVATRLRQTVQFLASEELAGRSPGSEGNERALRFISERFRLLGMNPLDTSYFQRFPVLAGVDFGRGNKAVLRIDAALGAGRTDRTSRTNSANSTNQSALSEQVPMRVPKRGLAQAQATKLAWTLGEDYTVLPFSEDSAAIAGIVFAGYGISAKELQYDDYDSVDVRGKFVILLRGAPDKNNPHSGFRAFASLRSKALNAREHGAVGMIVVNSAAESVGGDGLNGISSDDLPALRLDRTGNSGIMAIHAKTAAINAILPDGLSLYKLEERINTGAASMANATTNVVNVTSAASASKKPASFALPAVTLTLSTDLDRTQRSAANVIGFVRGTDTALARQYIVVGAHCDHLGMGEENSLYSGKEPRIHYGADDNASGTAGMLELAAFVAEKPLRRPVVFMAFNAEESGLLGSQWYCKYPLLPLQDCVMMMNLDMVGRLNNRSLLVQGTGTSPRWNPLLDSLAGKHNFTLSKTADGVGPSDHASFYHKNIPVLFLFTGLHDDYHRPSDTWDKLNYPGEEAVVRFAEDVLRSADASDSAPAFTKVQAQQAQRSTGFRVYVGTIPDYSDHPKGMRITGVREGSPAQKAGLQEGDVITKMGENRIKNVYDYTYALGNFKPGDAVSITLLRTVQGADSEVTTTLTLEARK